jgi:hypothetical protein
MNTTVGQPNYAELMEINSSRKDFHIGGVERNLAELKGSIKTVLMDGIANAISSPNPDSDRLVKRMGDRLGCVEISCLHATSIIIQESAHRETGIAPQTTRKDKKKDFVEALEGVRKTARSLLIHEINIATAPFGASEEMLAKKVSLSSCLEQNLERVIESIRGLFLWDIDDIMSQVATEQSPKRRTAGDNIHSSFEAVRDAAKTLLVHYTHSAIAQPKQWVEESIAEIFKDHHIRELEICIENARRVVGFLARNEESYEEPDPNSFILPLFESRERRMERRFDSLEQIIRQQQAEIRFLKCRAGFHDYENGMKTEDDFCYYHHCVYCKNRICGASKKEKASSKMELISEIPEI